MRRPHFEETETQLMKLQWVVYRSSVGMGYVAYIAAQMAGAERSRATVWKGCVRIFWRADGEVDAGRDPDADSTSREVAAAGIPSAPCGSSAGRGMGESRKMLKKVKPIKLGRQVYRRLMKRVLERDGWRCQKCGALENLQVHHKIKRSQQGDDALANLVTLCAYCHIAEHGQLFYAMPAIRVCGRPQPRRK
jgi:hypothetical protein